MRCIIALGLLVMICGCGGMHPSPEALAAADYGPYPDDYQNTIKTLVSASLGDPDGVTYQFGRPTKGHKSRGILFGGGVERYGWFVEVNVLAKNGFGGYSGGRRYTYFIHGDEYRMIAKR